MPYITHIDTVHNYICMLQQKHQTLSWAPAVGWYIVSHLHIFAYIYSRPPFGTAKFMIVPQPKNSHLLWQAVEELIFNTLSSMTLTAISGWLWRSGVTLVRVQVFTTPTAKCNAFQTIPSKPQSCLSRFSNTQKHKLHQVFPNKTEKSSSTLFSNHVWFIFKKILKPFYSLAQTYLAQKKIHYCWLM